MSFIRCLSNPEGLYVWSDVDGTVHIHYGGRKRPKPPLSKGDDMCVPYRDFMRACQKWDGWEDDVRVNGFRIKEEHVYLKTGKPVPNMDRWKKVSAYCDHMKKNPAEFLIRVSYKGNFVYLWRVTWQYVVSNAVRRIELRKKLRSGKRAKSSTKRR